MEKKKIIPAMKGFFNQNYVKYHVDTVFLYGSWSGGYPRKDSDVDLAILFSMEIKSEQRMFSLITSISCELEKEIAREVNIISISWDFQHPMLYYNAIVLGIPIFIKDIGRYISLKLEALYQMEDFQIFGTRWQYKISRDLLRR